MNKMYLVLALCCLTMGFCGYGKLNFLTAVLFALAYFL